MIFDDLTASGFGRLLEELSGGESRQPLQIVTQDELQLLQLLRQLKRSESRLRDRLLAKHAAGLAVEDGRCTLQVTTRSRQSFSKGAVAAALPPDVFEMLSEQLPLIESRYLTIRQSGPSNISWGV